MTPSSPPPDSNPDHPPPAAAGEPAVTPDAPDAPARSAAPAPPAAPDGPGSGGTRAPSEGIAPTAQAPAAAAPAGPRRWRPSRGFRIALLLVGFAAALALALRWRAQQDIEAAVAPEIRGVLARDSVAARRRGATRQQAVARLQRFYERRGHRPAWLDGDEPDRRATDLVHALGRLRQHGLDPAAYGTATLLDTLHTLRSWNQRVIVNPARLAAVDVMLSAAWLAAADDLDDGRLPRRALDPDWIAAGDTADLARQLHRALARNRVASSLEPLAPQDAAYSGLVQALRQYRAIAAAGGWRPLPARALQRGDEGPEVDSLRARLAAEGLGSGTRGSFDAALQKSLRTFQRRRGLTPDGRLTTATRAALDVPVASRIRTLEMNLERRRWIPRRRPEPFVEVNIPDFHLDVWHEGRSVFAMRVVVGATDTPTPVFSDEITWLEVNPTWRIPRGIVANEVLPAWHKDRDYFWKNQLHVLWTQGDGMPEVMPEMVDWSGAGADTFPFLVFQEAGPTNPLGRIKFMFPNEHDVYLHDTPAKRLFAAGARDRSHGCVRVEDPLGFAAYVLRDTSAGHPDSLAAMLDTTAWRRVRLKSKLPVHLMYWTAFTDSAGGVHFRDDVYGLDARLSQAIAAGRLEDFEINPKLVKLDEEAAAKPKPRRMSLWSRMRLF